MKTILLILALAASPVYAGGPVVVEDMTETAPIVQNKRDKTALILLGLALAVVIASGGGSDVCNGDETPAPQPGPCQ